MMSWPAAFITIALMLELVQPQHKSGDVVFHLRSTETISARELADEHGLEYVSEVFPGSKYHHAIKKKIHPIPFSMEKLSADPRVISIFGLYYS